MPENEVLPTDLNRALESVYAAVAKPETWAAALQQMASATNSIGCLLYPKDQARALLRLPISPDLEGFIDAYVQGAWYEIDPRAQRAWNAVDRGRVLLTDDDLMVDDEVKRWSPYFQDFQLPWKLPGWAAVAFKANGNHWCMVLLRDARHGPPDDRQKPQLISLSSHLGRIVELATLVDGRQSARQADLLEQSGLAVMLLDARGTVTTLTTAAERFVGREIFIRHNQLRFTDNEAAGQMTKMLSALRANQPLPSSYVAIRRDGQRPILIKITVLPPPLFDVFGKGNLLLRFFDSGTRLRPDGEAMRKAFGLTPAETRLAIELGQEQSLGHIAEKLAISKLTARVQLLSIFRKTDTHRQSELLALIANMPGAAPSPANGSPTAHGWRQTPSERAEAYPHQTSAHDADDR